MTSWRFPHSRLIHPELAVQDGDGPHGSTGPATPLEKPTKTRLYEALAAANGAPVSVEDLAAAAGISPDHVVVAVTTLRRTGTAIVRGTTYRLLPDEWPD
ncbi:hypothetical protein ACSMXM_01215 [Pacificimonas sp. ICDLI1SI03]